MLIGIFLSVFGLLAISSHLVCWALLVLSTLTTCAWLKPKVRAVPLTLYFVISVLGSLLFLLSCCNFPLSGIVLQLSILLKLGLAPFHFWIQSLICSLDLSSLFIFLGPSKTGLLWLLVNVSHCSLFLSLPSFLLGFTLLWLGTRVSIIVFASGSVQLLILSLMSSSSFFCYWSIYLLSLSGLFFLHHSLLTGFFTFLSLAGIPPLTMFWGKVFILSVLPLCSSLPVLTISLLSFWPYLHVSLSFRYYSTSSPLIVLLIVRIPIFFFFLLTSHERWISIPFS